MKLSYRVTEAIKKAGVHVYFADRKITKTWNKDKDVEDPLFYGGWYWNRAKKGKVVATDEDGPFRTESAAMRDAYVKLQLSHAPKR